jgi:TRAP-type C4-dicarboxylate transport system permease small subunit
VGLGSIGLAAASLILSYSVVSRSMFRLPTDWQDEAAVFCLCGVTFLCAAFVQEHRHHVGISAVAGLLPRPLERLRIFLIDFVPFIFCAFFTWKSVLLWHEAWIDGHTTSSSWGPPLAIPYGLMSAGMLLLSLQLLLQTFEHLVAPSKAS